MTAALKKIDGVYHAPVAASGKTTKWISTGSSNKQEAQAILNESGVEKLNIAAKAGSLTQRAIGQILTGKNLTCLKALEKFNQFRVVSRSNLTVANDNVVISKWLKTMGLENVPPSAVTPEHISQWINDPDSTWKRNTRQVALSSVKSFFDFCSHQGWVISNPSQMVDLDYSVMSHEQKEGSARKPFTEEEVSAILKALRADWKLSEIGKHTLFQDRNLVLFWLVAVSVAKETGLRLSDIAQLEWRSFGEPGKLIVWTEKTNKRMEHNISQSLQTLIGEVPVVDADYLFPEQRNINRDVSRRSLLSVQFRRLLDHLGVGENKSFHSLRHYVSTKAFKKLDKDALAAKLAESLSLEQIAALLGHSNKATTKGYVHD